MTEIKVSIIIPFFNRWDLVHQRLSELYKFAPDGCEVILVNDDSTELDYFGGTNWWNTVEKNFKIVFTTNEKNLGFGGSMNVGATEALGDILVFLSNDVRISGDFISEIVSLIDKNPNYFIGGEVIYWDGGWNSFIFGGKKTIVPYANGWLMACTRECWDKLGGFDPIYGRFDYEDVDISTSALLAGYDIISLGSGYVKHEHQGSTVSTLGVDRLAHTKQNREVYIGKWEKRLIEYSEVGEENGKGKSDV